MMLRKSHMSARLHPDPAIETAIYGTTVNLTRLREITQDLADLFGLSLPVLPQRVEAER